MCFSLLLLHPVVADNLFTAFVVAREEQALRLLQWQLGCAAHLVAPCAEDQPQSESAPPRLHGEAQGRIEVTEHAAHGAADAAPDGDGRRELCDARHLCIIPPVGLVPFVVEEEAPGLVVAHVSGAAQLPVTWAQIQREGNGTGLRGIPHGVLLPHGTLQNSVPGLDAQVDQTLCRGRPRHVALLEDAACGQGEEGVHELVGGVAGQEHTTGVDLLSCQLPVAETRAHQLLSLLAEVAQIEAVDDVADAPGRELAGVALAALMARSHAPELHPQVLAPVRVVRLAAAACLAVVVALVLELLKGIAELLVAHLGDSALVEAQPALLHVRAVCLTRHRATADALEDDLAGLQDKEGLAHRGAVTSLLRPEVVARTHSTYLILELQDSVVEVQRGEPLLLLLQ